MANVKISDLTGAASASGTQEFEVNDSGTSKKVTGSQLATFIEGEVSSSPTLTGQVSLDNGTSTAPSLTNTGDTNTGLYFPSDDTVALTAGGSANLSVNSSGVSVDGNLSFGDNDKAIFGDSQNLEIYANGGFSYIDEVGANNLNIRTNGADIGIYDTANSQYMARFATGGNARLYYNGSQKLATTSTGIDVTGTAVTDGLTVAGNVSVDGGTIKLDGNYPVGTNNVALGNLALSGSLSGSNNVAIGHATLDFNTSGSSNTGVGYASLTDNSTGADNTGVGEFSLANNTSGAYNTALGSNALQANTTASNNTAVGYQTAYNNTGGAITAVGQQALYSNTGSSNVAVGYQAAYNNTSGQDNVALGRNALRSNTTANNSTAVGYQAGYSNTTGSGIVAVGRTALLSNTTGSANTGVGTNALQSTTSGNFNTAIGQQSLNANTTASHNTAVGYQAGYNSVNADSTFIGTFSGYVASYAGTGRNTFIGYNSGGAVTTGRYNTILGSYNGNSGGLDIRTSSNNIVLSDGDGNPRLHIDSGNYLYHTGGQNLMQNTNEFNFSKGFNFTGGSQEVWINYRLGASAIGEYRFWNSMANSGAYVPLKASAFTVSSDYRLKENIVEMTGATERLKQLNPCRFNFKSDDSLKTEITQKDKAATVDGFLAHEVQSVVPEAVTGTKDAVNADGNPVYQGIDQSKLVPLLVATIKELEARITALENA